MTITVHLIVAVTRAAGADLLRPIMDKVIWEARIITRKLAGAELPATVITDKEIMVHPALPDFRTEAIMVKAVLLPEVHEDSRGKVAMAEEVQIMVHKAATNRKTAGAAMAAVMAEAVALAAQTTDLPRKAIIANPRKEIMVLAIVPMKEAMVL